MRQTNDYGSQRIRPQPRAIWLYGLSGAGKTTLALELEAYLRARDVAPYVLDGDRLRAGLNRDLGFTDADRTENIRRAAEVAKFLLDAGVVTICAFITPRRDLRDLARGIIGGSAFIEVYLDASFETCAKRDPKALYRQASLGKVPLFTGRDSLFEPPLPDPRILVLNTDRQPVATSLEQLSSFVLPQIYPRKHL